MENSLAYLGHRVVTVVKKFHSTVYFFQNFDSFCFVSGVPSEWSEEMEKCLKRWNVCRNGDLSK